jgi:fructose-bisphosphate aldolase, class II
VLARRRPSLRSGRVLALSAGSKTAAGRASAGQPGPVPPARAGAGYSAVGTPELESTEVAMPIATPEVYAEMLDRAKANGFAYPAINVTSSETLNAALRGFAEAGSDGIVQISTGGAEFISGTKVKDMVTGAVALAKFAHGVAAKYPVHVALHTDHCPLDKLDGYMRPLLAISAERVAAGREPLFQSHMWDGSAVELEENLRIAAELLDQCAKARVVMEMEIGVVGGEEDGVVGEMNEKLYSTPGDALRTAEVLGTGENGRYMLAATFGNVHGVYKPGNVKLRPEILKEIQDAVGAKVGREKPFDLVFHGGSGSLLAEIREAVSYGVVKMNVDTDTQYAFTRAVAGHMFTNYDGVLKVDGDVGNKKAYDPRSYLKLAETSMASRVGTACADLMSAGQSISG